MLFAVASALVNCTNSYDYEEPDPKMVELAKYAKQHVPEQHPKVSEPERLWGPLCLWDQLTWGIHSSLNFRVSKFLSLCTPVHQLCCTEGPPFPVQSAKSLLLISCLPTQDKAGFVRARVKKLLAAGVVSAMTCMVKTESPVLTNSCRELLSR